MHSYFGAAPITVYSTGKHAVRGPFFSILFRVANTPWRY